MFRPMALTVIFALTGSLLLSLTATPVLASFFLKPGSSEHETLPMRWAKRVYEPILGAALRHPVVVSLGALAGFAACVPVALGLGGEFIPQLDEGDLVIAQMQPPSSSLNEAISNSTRSRPPSAGSSRSRSARWSAGSAAPRSAWRREA